MTFAILLEEEGVPAGCREKVPVFATLAGGRVRALPREGRVRESTELIDRPPGGCLPMPGTARQWVCLHGGKPYLQIVPRMGTVAMSRRRDSAARRREPPAGEDDKGG